MRDGHRILDADGHVVEPGGIFGPAAHRPDLPSPLDLPADTPMEMVGDTTKLADFLADACSARQYLACLDTEGIDVAVLYPSLGLFVPFQPELDAAASVAACRGYDDWIADYCATDPARLHGVGILPVVDVDAAIAEARRAVDLGLVAVMVRPNPLYGRTLADPAYEPLWAAVAEAGVPLAVHEALGVRGPTIGRDRSERFAVRHALSHPMEQMAAMAGLLLEGVLERHPTLRVAFLESGTGWLPYWLHRLDEHAEWMADRGDNSLTTRPSEVFARQCVICSDPEDELCGWVTSRVGADHVTWASDFPHPDARYPEAVASFLASAADQGLAGADLDAVLWDTASAFYGIAAPTVAAAD